jgi:hypothetical protein
VKTSTEVNWPNTATLPFGKYRDQPISVLRGDPAYTHFLLTLKWFRNKYPELRAAIVGSNLEATVVELRAEKEQLRLEAIALRGEVGRLRRGSALR